MAFHFRILGSSSSGNCALLVTDRCKVLIDAGFSGRRIQQMLAQVGESVESLDAVLVTHEHGDHAMGLRGLSRHESIAFYANRDTAEAIQGKLTRKANWCLFENGRTFHLADIAVTAFSVPHDAYDPVGFVIEAGDGSLFSPHRSLAWVTDLGYLPQLVRERIREVDLLVVESNHDLELLENDTRRPWSVKQRIRGRHGHLSNQSVFEWLSEEHRPRWKEVCLAHLSRDCNSIPLIRKTFAPLLQPGRGYNLSVVDPDDGGMAFDLIGLH